MSCKCYSNHDYICPVGRDIEECRREVNLSIQRLFYWGAYADKYGGQVQVRSCDDHVILLREYSQCPAPSRLPAPLLFLHHPFPSPPIPSHLVRQQLRPVKTT